MGRRQDEETLLIVVLAIGGYIAYQKGLLTGIIQQLKQLLGMGETPTGGGSLAAGGIDSNGMMRIYGGTGQEVAIQKGGDPNGNGDRYNVNHKYQNYVIQGYFRTTSGQTAIGMKTDGPNHGDCKSRPECFIAGNKVLTSEGLKPIEQIKEGDLVYTHKGRFKQVLQTMKRFYEGDVYRINTFGSNYETVCTEEHPFLTKRGWVRAKNIIPYIKPKQHVRGNQDSILLSKPTIVQNVNEITIPYTIPTMMRYGRRYNYGHIRDFSIGFEQKQELVLPLEEELLTIIAYYLAEGRAEKSKVNDTYNEIYFTFGNNEIENKYAVEVYDSAKKLGLKPTRFMGQYGYVVRFSSNPLSNWIVKEFGTGAKYKKLPQWVIDLPNNKLEILFEKYINGDGCRRYTNKSKTFEKITASISENLTYQFGLIALKLGYKIRLRKWTSKPIIQGRSVNTKPVYELTVTEKSKKENRIWIDGQYQYQSIKNIKKEWFSGPVYNLEVEDDNSYVVHNHVVHNCLWIDPDLQLSDCSIKYGAEFPHPDANDLSCSSCTSCGQDLHDKYVGIASVAYGPPNARWNEVWVDPGGLTNDTTPVNQWQMLLKERYTDQIPSDWQRTELPLNFDRGLEAEIRMRGGHGTDMKYGVVYEINAPGASVTTPEPTAYARSYNTYLPKIPVPVYASRMANASDYF